MIAALLQADGEEGEVAPARTNPRYAAARAPPPCYTRPAGDMWEPPGGYEALAAAPTDEALQA